VRKVRRSASVDVEVVGEIDMTERTFTSNEEAFEYACEHLDCSLEDGKPVLGIVLAVQGRMCSVKIANREDKTIPSGTLTELLARTDVTHVCHSAMLADKVPQLQPGDLVLYTTMPELAAAGKPTVAGTVTAKVTPHYTGKGWQAYSSQPKPEAPAANPEAAAPASDGPPPVS
jgi:hypothetical protein